MDLEDTSFPHQEEFYRDSMFFVTSSAVASIFRLDSYIKKIEKNNFEEINFKFVLNQFQNIVQQGGALSRYFWPVRSKDKPRVIALRASFGMTPQSPLYDRELRNSIEHFDERLDEYLKDGIYGHIIPQYVGFSSRGEPEIPTHIFRAYYLDTGEFVLLNRRYKIEPIAEELIRVNDLLAKD